MFRVTIIRTEPDKSIELDETVESEGQAWLKIYEHIHLSNEDFSVRWIEAVSMEIERYVAVVEVTLHESEHTLICGIERK